MGSWTPEEDARLLAAYEEVGVYWMGVAERVGGGRTQKACRMRYNRLVPPVEEEVKPVEPVTNKATDKKKKKNEKKNKKNEKLKEPGGMDPWAILQSRRDPLYGVPAGMAIFDMETGRGITQQSMDKYSENLMEKLESKLREMGHDVDEYEDRIVVSPDLIDEILPELNDMSFGEPPWDEMTEPEPEPSMYDQAVAALVVQYAQVRPDAEEAAEEHVKHMLATRFGDNVDYESPEVVKYLDEFVAHQLSHFKKKGERKKKKPMTNAGSLSTKTATDRTAYQVHLGGPSGPMTRVVVSRDLNTGVETILEEMSDMDRILEHVAPIAAMGNISARQFVHNSVPSQLMDMLSMPNTLERPPRGNIQARRSVKQNVERLVAMTGHPLEDTMYVMTPLQVYRNGRWSVLPHFHEQPSKRADPDDKIPFKQGLSILRQQGEIIINKWSVWMGRTWCDTATVIDTSSNVWKVTDHALFCYSFDLNQREPYSQDFRDEMDLIFEGFVESWRKEMDDNIRRHRARYEWTTIRPGNSNESMCKARSTQGDYPILIELGRPVLYSAIAKTARLSEKVAKYVREGGKLGLHQPGESLPEGSRPLPIL